MGRELSEPARSAAFPRMPKTARPWGGRGKLPVRVCYGGECRRLSRQLCLLQRQPDMPEQFPIDRLYAGARVNGSDVFVLGPQFRHQ